MIRFSSDLLIHRNCSWVANSRLTGELLIFRGCYLIIKVSTVQIDIYIYNIIIYYISKYQVPWRYWSANVVRTAQTCWHELKMGSSQEWFWWRFMCQLLRTCSGYSHQNAVTPIVLGVVLIELLDDSWFHPIIPSDSDDIRCWSYMLYPSHPITRNRHMFETERPKSPKRIFLALLTLPVRFWYSHVKYCHMCKWFTYKRWYNIMIFHGKLW